MAHGKMSTSMLLVVLLAIASCTPSWGMARNERQLWIANRRTSSSVINHHDPEQIQQTEELKAETATISSSAAAMMMPVAVEEIRSSPNAAAATADTAVLPADHRNLALVDLELNNPRAPMKRTPDNVPQPGAIPREELERLEAAAAARAQSGASNNNQHDERNEGVIIAVATLVPLAVLAASFMVLRKTQRSRSDLASSHLSPDFAAPDMSFPAAAAPHRSMSLGGGGRGGRVVSSTLDTIPEEQEDLVGKSPFRFRGIV